MTQLPKIIAGSNLSQTWAAFARHTLAQKDSTSAPAIIILSGYNERIPEEDPSIRSGIDALLDDRGLVPIRASAMTIFPYQVWRRRSSMAPAAFHELCLRRLAPRMKSRDRKNHLGIYFERMMSFTGISRGEGSESIDQLAHVITLLRGDTKHRRSALQISCFDPLKDHSASRQRGFPCLQQVSVDYDGDHGLTLTGLYPSQYVVGRGYGNLLGLCHLGDYLATQSDRRLTRMTCISLRPQIDGTRTDLIKMLDRCAPVKAHR